MLRILRRWIFQHQRLALHAAVYKCSELTLNSFSTITTFSAMEMEELAPLYGILESSSNFWLQPPPPLTSLDHLFSPQTCNTALHTITSPPPQSNRPQNLNSNIAGVEQPVISGKRSGRDKTKKKDTWYKGPWTIHEDRKLINLVNRIGLRKWASVAEHMGRRIGKQCRERWHNNLRPNIRKSVVWSDEEEALIIAGHRRFGNRWSEIAKYIPGRSENAVKNHWNSIKRRQTSKKRIKRPANLRHLYQSNLLENYIKMNFFNTGTPPPPAAATTVAPPTTNGDQTAMDLPLGNADSGASTSELAVGTVDEDMSFLGSFFGDINGGN